MGIRFYCPNGHKLNVKEFQAGRRGICPFCGSRIQIPTQSTRPSSKQAKRGDAALPVHGGEDDSDAAQASDSSPDILPGEPPSLPGDPGGGKMLGPSTPVGIPTGGGVIAPPTPQPAPRPAVGGSPLPASLVRPEETRSAVTVPAAAPVQAAPPMPSVTPQVLRSAPAPIQPAAVHSQPAAPVQPPSVQPASVQPVAPPAPQPPVSEPADPIGEAPEMIWYVRPPSGGQFGPAPGDLMRTWLSEGRVSADSLVWREGWRDWQEAGTVFPKLRSNQVIDFLETAPVASVAPTGHAHSHRPKPRPASDRNQIALLVVLSLAVVVLIVVFLLVLFNPL